MANVHSPTAFDRAYDELVEAFRSREAARRSHAPIATLAACNERLFNARVAAATARRTR